MPEEAPVATVVAFAGFEVDLQTGELRKHGVRIKLQDQPFQILAMLLEHPGELVTREQIRQRLWPKQTFVDFDHSVNTAIRRLREALSDSADTPRFIETVPRHGYRFLADARPYCAIATPGSLVKTLEAGCSETILNAELSGERRTHRRRYWAIAAVLIVLAAAFAIWWVRSTTKIASVAVLPFVNETKDSKLDYLCVALPGRIIDSLSEVPGLRVASHNSTTAAQSRARSIREVASVLNIRAVVLGAIARKGDALQVTVELVDANDDRHLWGGEYKVRESDLPVLEQSIAAEIANKLHYQPTPRMVTRIRPIGSSTLAYQATLRGEYALERRENENFRVALQYFQQAIKADPDYTPAHVGMAKAYCLLVAYGGMRGSEAFPLAEASTLHALRLAPDLAAAHAQNGYILMNLHRDLKSAEHEFQRAVELNPNIAETYQGLSVALARAGRTDEAIASAKRAEELDPLWPAYANVLAQTYLDGKRYDEALKLRDKRPVLQTNYLLYAQVYALMGRRSEAHNELSKLRLDDLTPPLTYCLAAQAFGMAGEKERAMQLLHEAFARQEKLGNLATRGCTPYSYAAIYAAVGDRASMLRMLDEAEKQFDMKVGWLPVEPVFDPYRSDRHFKEIVRRVTTPR